MNYQIVTASTGTSISLSFIEVYGNATPAAAATGSKYQHFDNTSIQQRKQMYNSFGGQMVKFG
jgi:hypothetical protein